MSALSHSKECDGRMILNAVHGIGPIIHNRLMAKFDNDPWKILRAKESELNQVNGVGKKTIASIKQILESKWIDKEKYKLGKMGAKFIHSTELPEFLSQLMDPPIGLYLLGEIPQLPFFSIVGTRVPSQYGKKLARKLAFELSQAGLCIVSGLARGVDSEAHKGALEAGGKTIAFLGSGLDVIYPPENLDLYRKIHSSGAVLSEFPLGRRADRRTFPMRNRLVAGVSMGVLVIESAKSGGSMITAKFAAEQGRIVFALPGRVDQPESQGCLDLLRDGATLVRKIDDILEELEPMIGKIKDSAHGCQSIVKKDFPSLNDDESLIMKALSAGDRFASEDLQKLTNLCLSKIIPAITMLEIRGLVTKRPDGKFESNL